jgi:hypothetical protein
LAPVLYFFIMVTNALVARLLVGRSRPLTKESAEKAKNSSKAIAKKPKIRKSKM